MGLSLPKGLHFPRLLGGPWATTEPSLRSLLWPAALENITVVITESTEIAAEKGPGTVQKPEWGGAGKGLLLPRAVGCPASCKATRRSLAS